MILLKNEGNCYWWMFLLFEEGKLIFIYRFGDFLLIKKEFEGKNLK